MIWLSASFRCLTCHYFCLRPTSLITIYKKSRQQKHQPFIRDGPNKVVKADLGETCDNSTKSARCSMKHMAAKTNACVLKTNPNCNGTYQQVSVCACRCDKSLVCLCVKSHTPTLPSRSTRVHSSARPKETHFRSRTILGDFLWPVLSSSILYFVTTRTLKHIKQAHVCWVAARDDEYPEWTDWIPNNN